MTLEDFMNYCLQKKGAKKEYIFKELIPVCTVGNKKFCVLCESEASYGLILKSDPELNHALRQKYEGIRIPRTFDSRYWNIITIDSDIPSAEILFLIDLSYNIVFNSLTKKVQKTLLNFNN